ncbi:FUS-interacting serine-arginine-rich protein 1 [Fistulifera solaris]|uniref:FUS-interacting serine-arginine-rich protein 1 n=1 Tax=Fistulifera solaris TaxID=1519565 RepID=A0A1Z5JGT6_FISSO|nr:FUS-interacting serine-arginine-rich protein 1 [Fistulifera solaris]|eukprot:GAX13210.1 FUS-interacting serine-arginine-rich protein 1 [Fistulifera solaris]
MSSYQDRDEEPPSGPPPRDREDRDSDRHRRRRRSRSWSRSPDRRRGRSRSRSPRRYRSYSPSPDSRRYRDDRYRGPPPRDYRYPPYHDDHRHRDYGPPPPYADPYYRGPPPPHHGGPPGPPRRRDRGERRRDEGPPGVSLLIRNVSPDITTQDLQSAFGRIGEIRDVYIPRDYHSQQPKGFAFIEYATAALAAEARDEMDRFVIRGRELEVVFAQERRKTPNEMRGRVVNQHNRGGSSERRGRSSSFERHKQRERDDPTKNDGREEGEGNKSSSDSV